MSASICISFQNPVASCNVDRKARLEVSCTGFGPWIFTFIYSFNNYLLRTSSFAKSRAKVRDTTVNKTDKNPSLYDVYKLFEVGRQ